MRVMSIAIGGHSFHWGKRSYRPRTTEVTQQDSFGLSQTAFTDKGNLKVFFLS